MTTGCPGACLLCKNLLCMGLFLKNIETFQEGEYTGIEFIDENCGGPGVRLRKRQRLKKPK